jgi:hypothetical protein
MHRVEAPVVSKSFRVFMPLSLAPDHSKLNRAKYFRSLSESLIVLRRDRLAPNKLRPASARDRDLRQMSITDSSCRRSKTSSF